MKKWGIPLFCLAVDQGLKALVAATVTGEAVLLPGVLTVSPTLNPGISFGFLGNSPFFGTVIGLAFFALLLFFVKKNPPGRFGMMCFLVAAGGYAGNLIDRLRLGYVFDFLYFPFLPFFVCNPADIMICLGLLGTCIDYLRKKE